ncbi:hypothetical protein AB0I30_34405 [Nocardia tengchongensis]|uniref:hypothetical protein n=1 Tax=Nocardia tengchongensis TaxID=2055889 RepID=UPI0033C1F754
MAGDIGRATWTRFVFALGALMAILVALTVSHGPAGSSQTDFDLSFDRPQYLIHITGHGTVSGPVADNQYILYFEAPDSTGVFRQADGYGGTVTYSADYYNGPLTTPRSVCQAAQVVGLPAQSWTPYNRTDTFDCGLLYGSPETITSAAPQPGPENTTTVAGPAGSSSSGGVSTSAIVWIAVVGLTILAAISAALRNAKQSTVVESRVISGDEARRKLWQASHPAGQPYDPNKLYPPAGDFPPGISGGGFSTLPDGRIDPAAPFALTVDWTHPAQDPTDLPPINPPTGGFRGQEAKSLVNQLTKLGWPVQLVKIGGVDYVQVPENLPERFSAATWGTRVVGGKTVIGDSPIVISYWP